MNSSKEFGPREKLSYIISNCCRSKLEERSILTHSQGKQWRSEMNWGTVSFKEDFMRTHSSKASRRKSRKEARLVLHNPTIPKKGRRLLTMWSRWLQRSLGITAKPATSLWRLWTRHSLSPLSAPWGPYSLASWVEKRWLRVLKTCHSWRTKQKRTNSLCYWQRFCKMLCTIRILLESKLSEKVNISHSLL